MESHKEDNDEDSEKTDWGMLFMLLKSRGFSHNEILQLSYPQFKAYMDNINDPVTFSITIPYLGSGEDSEDAKENVIKSPQGFAKGNEIRTKEELLSIVASMNNDFN